MNECYSAIEFILLYFSQRLKISLAAIEQRIEDAEKIFHEKIECLNKETDQRN